MSQRMFLHWLRCQECHNVHFRRCVYFDALRESVQVVKSPTAQLILNDAMEKAADVIQERIKKRKAAAGKT